MLAVGQTGQIGQAGLLQQTIIILSVTRQCRLRKIYSVSCSTKTYRPIYTHDIQCRPIYTHDIQILMVKGSRVTNSRNASPSNAHMVRSGIVVLIVCTY